MTTFTNPRLKLSMSMTLDDESLNMPAFKNGLTIGLIIAKLSKPHSLCMYLLYPPPLAKPYQCEIAVLSSFSYSAIDNCS